MKHLSRWARAHPFSARFIIVLSKLLLVCLAANTGLLLLDLGIFLSPAWILPLAMLTIIAICQYPRTDASFVWKLKYSKQKICDFAVCLLGFMLIVMVVNQGILPKLSTPASAATCCGPSAESRPTPGSNIALVGSNARMLTRHEKKIIRKEFRKRVTEFMRTAGNGENKPKGVAWKIALTLVVATLLTGVVAGLACSLSCSGAEGLAVFVAILGLAAVIVGAVAVIRRIIRGPTPKIKTNNESGEVVIQ